jgi:tRNA pseudouridine13 synthase
MCLRPSGGAGQGKSKLSSLQTATIRATPEDFRVDEIPAYEPQGSGDHLYVHFEKTGLNTLDAVRDLARALAVSDRDAGTAGMKDRHAVTTQWASFPFAKGREEAEALALELPGIRVLAARRHANKLKTGHLRGNRFTIVLRDVARPDELATALEHIGAHGVPNAYGKQRYGWEGKNVERAVAWLKGDSRPPRGKKEQRLLVSALQSSLFDAVLARRPFDAILPGDLAYKHDSGGLFLVTEAEHADAVARAARGEICATGPMFGSKMRAPEGEPAKIEAEVLAEKLGDMTLLDRAGRLAQGARRPLLLEVKELHVSDRGSDSLTVAFVLPKGGYATTVLGQACTPQESRR